ncbi:MAG: 50S ribosomal protein L35 [Patescibacteria group bacterium]|jgi:large subunit ribosomal protein L35|nr:50S ribosomal protein L35 [Patescibacteria group bacterium]
MPKIKTSKTTAKRFKITASGKVMRLKATRGHLKTKKSASRKRAYSMDMPASESDVRNIKRALGV